MKTRRIGKRETAGENGPGAEVAKKIRSLVIVPKLLKDLRVRIRMMMILRVNKRKTKITIKSKTALRALMRMKKSLLFLKIRIATDK